MKNTMIKKAAFVAAITSAFIASSAHAAVDTAAVTSALTDAGAAIAVVGAAVLVVIVGTKVFKWVARAL
jgi:hypothetical protein